MSAERGLAPPGPEAPDPHLLAALRHAPDHDAAPPADLSLRITQLARASLQRPPGPWARALVWLQSLLVQPVAASAFGTLLLAGFIGLMWREGVPPEALPQAEHGAAPAVVPLRASDAVAARVTAATLPPADSPAAAPEAPVLRTRAAPEGPRDGLAQKPSTPTASTKPAATQTAATKTASAETAAPQDAAAAPAVARGSAVPAPAAPSPSAQKLEAAERVAAAPVPAAEPPAPRPEPGTSAGAAPAQPPPATAPAPSALLRLRDARQAPAAAPSSTAPPAHPINPALDPLAAPLAQLLASPSDSPLVLATREQLAGLQRAARGLWRVAPLHTAARAGTPVLDAEGRPLGYLLLQGRDLSWQSGAGRWQARLASAPH